MKITKQATKGHLLVGAFLVFLSLGSLILAFLYDSMKWLILIFFFGVWGGVELGRYLEHWMSQRSNH